MIDTYYIDVTQFDNESLFREKSNLLSPYRQQKIRMLKHRKDQNRSLGAGLALAHALERYGLTERSIEYGFGEWGKPFLKDKPDLHFSLSHSGDYAICTIGVIPVGSDIERIKPGRLNVAERFFAPEEQDFLYAVQDEEERNRRMFRIWTMKESFLKVTGRGISLPLGEFAVVVEEETGRIRVKHTCTSIPFRKQTFHNFKDMDYHMKEYGEIPGYRAAVCWRGDGDIADSMKPVVL